MKKFSLEEFKKHQNRKVVTRDRKATARIICTDCKSEYPVIALLSYSENSEGCEAYTADGRFSIDGEGNSDLFFDTCKKEGWANLYMDEEGDYTLGRKIYDSKEKAKESSNNIYYLDTIHIEWEE